MTARVFSISSWLRATGFARVALLALTLARLYSLREHTPPLLHVACWIFFACALAWAIFDRRVAGTLGLLALFADTVWFLLLAAFEPDALPWLVRLVYLFLLVEAIGSFGPVEVLVVGVTSSVFCLLIPGAPRIPVAPFVVTTGSIVYAASLWKRRAEAIVRNLESQLIDTQKANEKALETERLRIASDFHDGPLQNFISLQMRLEILRRLLERDFAAGMQELRDLQTLAQSQIRELRAFLNSMRPADIEAGNLMASARRTAELFQKESGIPVTFLGANSTIGVPHETSLQVLQMLREALHNVQKHSGATRVAVAVDNRDHALELSVDDNGRGFPFSGAYSLEELELLRLGPASLKRRARSLNADLTLESRPGRGAGLKFRVPL